jgi:hypothetical protein
VEKASMEWRGEWSGLVRTGLEGQGGRQSDGGHPSPPMVLRHMAYGVRGASGRAQERARGAGWAGLRG